MLNESKAMFHVNYTKNADVKEGIASFLGKRAPQWVLDGWHDLPTWLPFHARTEVAPTHASTLLSKLTSKL